MKVFFINLAIFDKVLVNEAMNAKFTIFAENFNAMKLSKDQKNLLKGGLAGWAGMVVAAVLFAVFGKRTWSDTLWLVLGLTIAEIIVSTFLMLGSRVPKEKGEKNE